MNPQFKAGKHGSAAVTSW